MAIVTKEFITTGMHCPSCSMLIQMDVSDLKGVTSVVANHQTSLTEVVFDDDVVGPDDIIAVITAAGYGAELAED